MGVLRTRDLQEQDWSAVALLASDQIQEADHSGTDTVWVENRLSFDGSRQQAVVESNGSVVGYCSIERAADDEINTYRLFLVADWDAANSDVHEALFSRAESMLQEAGATRAWMRELTGDLGLLRFVERGGFQASTPYSVAGKEMVNLTKQYDAPTRGR
jgi:hypothetical protein